MTDGPLVETVAPYHCTTHAQTNKILVTDGPASYSYCPRCEIDAVVELSERLRGPWGDKLRALRFGTSPDRQRQRVRQ